MCRTVSDGSFLARAVSYTPCFWAPMYEPRKHKRRLRFKLRERPSAKPWLRMSFRSKPSRFNPWVYNNKPYIWKPAHKR